MICSRYLGIPLLTAISLAVSMFLLTIQSADAASYRVAEDASGIGVLSVD